MKTGIRVLLKMAAELPAESNERLGKVGFLPLSGAEESFSLQEISPVKAK